MFPRLRARLWACVCARSRYVLSKCHQAWRRVCVCLQASPVMLVAALLSVGLIVTILALLNALLARLVTFPGALMLNALWLWLLLRLVVRALVFPGSTMLWKRNTEASYRVEMSKQFARHLWQLLTFLQAATGQECRRGGATLEGALLGAMVVEGLARNFRAQQRDQVRFTTEQAHVRLLVHAVEAFLGDAKVRDHERGGVHTQVPLLDWLQRTSRSSGQAPLNSAVTSALLATEAEGHAAACIDRLEQLVAIVEGLQRPQDGVCANAQRFLRVPTLGSLHQLRAELLVRYSGQHHWVRGPGGRKIDAMLISCTGSLEGDGDSEDEACADSSGCKHREETPLNDLEREAALSPVIVWCNPNAAYYETMAYESHWLDFYLQQGCSVFLFNYSGFGRSEGHPRPATLEADGAAIIEFLRRRGFTQVGVHGRSIGGIAACSLAAANPDIVRFLVADRTFSTLSLAAKYTFGNWAATGLRLSATWADNVENYLQAKCYKVMLCDPKDMTVPDVASLRVAIAIDALRKLPECDRLVLDDDKILRLVQAWAFFDTLVAVCSGDEEMIDRSRGLSEAPRPARQPVVSKPTPEDARTDLLEEDTKRLVPAWPLSEARKSVIDARWLAWHGEVVRAVFQPIADSLRLALDIVGSGFNSSGLTLEDALSHTKDEAAVYAVKCFLANLQVWGSLGSLQGEPCAGADRGIEAVLQHDGSVDQESLEAEWAREASRLTPERLSHYHRSLTRSSVAKVRRDFRVHLTSMRRSLEVAINSREEGSQGAQLSTAALAHLSEVEGFVSAIHRFFRSVDVANGGGRPSTPSSPSDPGSPGGLERACSGGSDEGPDGGELRAVRPALDRAALGHCMCVDCGHNGVISDGEARHLALHLRAARFGRHGCGDAGGTP